MDSKAYEGVLGALEAYYRHLPHDELVQEVMSTWEYHLEAKARRDKAGAIARAAKFRPKQEIAAKVYVDLKKKMRKVSAKKWFVELQHQLPAVGWNYNTVRTWHKPRETESRIGGGEKNT